ncbi:MAG: hypothetical protein R2835_02435 [Thermomicrobiales bacterium]
MIWRQHGDSAKICTIPPGVDTELFRPLDQAACRLELGIPAEEQMVLFVGRIDPIKGLDTLLGATSSEDYLKSVSSPARIAHRGEEICSSMCRRYRFRLGTVLRTGARRSLAAQAREMGIDDMDRCSTMTSFRFRLGTNP